MSPTVTKSERLAVRLSEEQRDLIDRAAEAEGRTVTDFTVQATITHARDVLADRRLFLLNAAAWTELNAILDRPTSRRPRLEKQFDSPSIFE
ncbi:MAG TPA: DUF1778 domain-containing protein [Acidothermaceae bacterium]|jgi:uncharacterized protein (DUF1778 family)